jgi:hypothetical protein
LALQLVMLKTVPVGAELTLDYRLSIDEQASPPDYSCHCDLPACRCTMAAVTDSRSQA